MLTTSPLPRHLAEVNGAQGRRGLWAVVLAGYAGAPWSTMTTLAGTTGSRAVRSSAPDLPRQRLVLELHPTQQQLGRGQVIGVLREAPRRSAA